MNDKEFYRTFLKQAPASKKDIKKQLEEQEQKRKEENARKIAALFETANKRIEELVQEIRAIREQEKQVKKHIIELDKANKAAMASLDKKDVLKLIYMLPSSRVNRSVVDLF